MRRPGIDPYIFTATALLIGNVTLQIFGHLVRQRFRVVVNVGLPVEDLKEVPEIEF